MGISEHSKKIVNLDNKIPGVSHDDMFPFIVTVLIILVVVYFAYKILSPSGIEKQIKQTQQNMDSLSNNSVAMESYAGLDRNVQDSNMPVNFKRLISNGYVWLGDRVNEPNNQFKIDTNNLFININKAYKEIE